MGKSSSIVTGYHYRPAFHQALGRGPIDAYLEWRVADKPAWQGELTASGTITVSKPHLFGGTKDQGGVEGDVDIMFGEADQLPNPYLVSTFGPQTVAWRGFTTMAFKGGRYGANNPYAHPNASKIRKILKGWDNDDPWYPEKAIIPLIPGVLLTADLAFPATSAAVGPYAGVTFNTGFTAQDVLIIDKPPGLTYEAWSRWDSDSDPDAEGLPWTNTFWVTANGVDTQYWSSPDPLDSRYATAEEADAAFHGRYVALTGADSYTIWLNDEPVSDNRGGLSVRVYKGGLFGMNPAHILVYSRTDSERGREPIANINADSLTAGADRLLAEGFGICTEYDPATESPVEFEQRISRVIAGSFERSLTDGQWYLDLARGDYDIESLPILTDDDILEFKEQPTTLDRAVNSLSVRYFDPEKKELIVTPAVRALGLIRKFGEIHETLDFPEIPTGALALRVAERELRARCTPTHGFKLVTTPKTYAWRRNQYFRLQSVKRGIADMVCIVGQKSRGTLKSGAIDLVATQDIYSLPATSYVEIEPGVDTSPPVDAEPIDLQRAFEAPYIELAPRIPRAELAALPEDVGFVMAVASDPSVGMDFTMMVAPDGGNYVEAGTGYWSPTATTAALVDRWPSPTVVALDTTYRLSDVEIGAPVLWDDELCRVEAKDTGLNTVTLGRGCADTVPDVHASGSRLWFYDGFAAGDTTEYTDGETVDVKLLSNTGSDRLDLSLATAMPVELDQRAYRPYPPARIRVNTLADPSELFGLLTVEWAHRDRVLQADQVVDTEAATIGPEAGTTYTVRWYLDDVLEHTHSGVTGTSETYTPTGDGIVRIEVESVRDGVTSWQMQVREFSYTTSAGGDLNSFFSNLGATGPFYSQATFPSAFQDSTGKSRLFFEAWSGHKRITRTASYDHASGLFGEFRGVFAVPLTDDEHGVPAACEDSSGYLHTFGGSHNSSLFHYGALSPISSVTDPAFTLRHTFSGSYAYPKPVAVGSSLYLICREFVGAGKYVGVMFKTSALSAGVPTWVPRQTIVDFGTARVYFGNLLLVGTDIHIVATRADSTDTERKGVYYFVIDTTTDDVRNFDGSTTVANASLPVDLATADASFRLIDHGSNRGDIPYLAFDSSGNPHVTYVDGSGTLFNFVHIMHNGTSWTSPLTIAPITGQTSIGFVGTCAIAPLAAGEVAFHYPDNSVGIYRGEAGDWKTRTRSSGGVLGSASTVLAAGTAKLGRMSTPVNPHANLRAIASEIAPSANDSDAGGLRIYGHGDGGFIGPPNITLDSSTSTIISAFSTEPDIERKLAINDLVVRLKAFGLWTKIDALYLLAAHESAAGLVNWKNPGTHDLTLHGTASPTFTADSGFTTDGVDNYLSTNFNPATAGGNFTQNSACFGIWSGTSTSGAGSAAGWYDGSDGITLIPRSGADRFVTRINQAATTDGTAVISDGTGLYVANRSGSGTQQVYRNGSSLTITGAQTSTTLNSANLRLGSITASLFRAFLFKGAVIGGSLTSTEQANLYSSMLDYMQQVGAAA